MKQLHVSREGRKQQVYSTMYALQRSFTMYELAQLIHMSPSKHFTGILMEMVDDGDLAFWEVQHRPNSTKRVFYIRSLGQPLAQTSMAI